MVGTSHVVIKYPTKIALGVDTIYLTHSTKKAPQKVTFETRQTITGSNSA